jgi:hypothetical protein
MLRLVQAGSGPRRLLVVAYFCANRAALLASLPSSACVVIDVDNPAGRFARPIGAGGVDSLEDVIAWARKQAGFEDVLFVILIGWSAGCQALREQLRAGARPDVVLALDGISGSVPPTHDQLEPWRALVARARADECCAVIAHTAMTYTERLPPAQRYASTTRTAELVTGTIGEAPPATGGIMSVEGELYVLAYPSKDIDGEAHKYQQSHVLPDLLARIAVPWLLERGLLDAPAPTTRTGTAPAVRVEVLRYGLKGPAVCAWQELLRARGYPVAVDGDFGPATAAATRALQRAAGLVVDGIVGPATRAAATAISSRGTSSSSTAPPLSEAEKDALFGVVAWVPQ